jgi:protoporphyrinogen oxidase
VTTGWRLSRLARAAGGAWRLTAADGRSLEADAVVSTIPIPTLLEALGEPALLAHAPAFAANDTYFAAVGLKPGRRFARFASCHWVFFAGRETFYRVSLMQSFSPRRPATLVAEITRKGEAAARGADELGARVLRDLLARGVVAAESDVEFVDVRLQRYTYPIPTLGMARARRALEEELEKRRLYLLGRSGRWDYVNTDGVFMAVDAFAASRLGALGGRA